LALINLDPYVTVKKLKEGFNSETGLNLIVYDINKLADDSMVLSKLLGKDNCLSSKYRSYKLNSFYHFCLNTDIKKLKKEIFEIYGIKIDIKSNGSILNNKSILSDYIPEFIKNKKYNFERIDALNERLIKIEKDIYNQWLKLKQRLNSEILNSDDWLLDYEIELDIGYYLDEIDPLYDEDTENLLINYSGSLGKRELISGMINDGYDHNDVFFDMNFSSPHCYLFHDLSNHNRVTFNELQRIGKIWVDINVSHQHCYENIKV
jgi:hypothetical protein